MNAMKIAVQGIAILHGLAAVWMAQLDSVAPAIATSLFGVILALLSVAWTLEDGK